MPIGRIVSIQRLGITTASLQIQHIRLEVQPKTGEMDTKLQNLLESNTHSHLTMMYSLFEIQLFEFFYDK